MLHLWLKIVNSSFRSISASHNCIPAYIPSILEYSLYIPPFLNCARPRARVLEVLTPDDFDVKVLEVHVVEDLKLIGTFVLVAVKMKLLDNHCWMLWFFALWICLISAFY